MFRIFDVSCEETEEGDISQSGKEVRWTSSSIINNLIKQAWTKGWSVVLRKFYINKLSDEKQIAEKRRCRRLTFKDIVRSFRERVESKLTHWIRTEKLEPRPFFDGVILVSQNPQFQLTKVTVWSQWGSVKF
jgi:hypothetical protein